MSVLLLEQWHAAGVRVLDRLDRRRDVLGAALDTDERVVLDLHASGDYQSNGEWLKMRGQLQLEPGACVRIRTREQIQLSKAVIGLILSRVSLAGDGLSVVPVKIDPQFLGQPEIAVANASLRRIRLEKDLSFASLMIFKLDKELEEDLPRVVSPTRSLEVSRWRDRVRRTSPFVVTGIVTLIAASAPEIVRSVFG